MVAPKKSLRPKSREQVDVENQMQQFGNLEFRADMDEQLRWNPLARLGFEPDQSVVGRPRYNSPDIHEGIRYPYYAEQEYIDETLPEAASGAEYRDIAGRVKPGSVVVNSNTAKNPVWSHEYTHGGIEKVIEYLNEDREFFTEKYGEDTVKLLDEIQTDTNRSKGPNEKLTEMLDDVSKDAEVDIHGHLIPAAGTALGGMDSTRTAVEDVSSRASLQEYLKKGRVSDNLSGKASFEASFPGYSGIFKAAEDMLEKQGEPLPSEKRGWWERKTRQWLSGNGLFAQGGVVSNMNNQTKMAFNEGGIADDGLNRDPVSGNEIPPGSLAEEVRDDIPAQLSEGEYVVPADVVRFFGVKFFEDLRTEAKMGLSNMEANGRIGGEPVDMPMAQASNPNEITEEDLAQLEQMLSTGVANGGLMDKIAIAAKTDKVINDRMNANGMVVGYAAGGEVTAPTASYADPTRVDAVINKVMATLQQKPELIQELSKRGIQISRTNPSMEAGQMNQANPPAETRKAFALGGPLIPMPTVPGYGTGTSYTTPTGLPSWAAVPGSSYTYQGPGVPPAPDAIPAATTEPAVAAPSSTEESCKAMGMGYDPVTQTCILVDSGDSGPVTTPEPAEFKWEEPDVNYFEMSEEELAAIGTGAKIDPFLNKLALGAAVVSGPLGLLVGGYNAYQQGKAISEVRAAALVAKARGFDDLADTLSKQADDLVSKSSFLVQGANTFGGLSGSNDFFQQVAAFSPEGFKLDKDAFKGKPELQKRYVEAVGKAMETRYDKQQSASNFGVTTAEEQRAILSDPAKLKEARDKAAAYKAEMAKKEATTVTTSAPWVSSSNEDGNTAHEDMMKAVASKKTTDPSGQSVTETTYSTPGGGSFTVGADEDGLYKGGLMKKRKKKK